MMMLFCWFQDLKANESRLRDINKVASELESEGLMAEEAPMVQAQVSSASTDNLMSCLLCVTCNQTEIMFPSIAAARDARLCSRQGRYHFSAAAMGLLVNTP